MPPPENVYVTLTFAPMTLKTESVCESTVESFGSDPFSGSD